MFDERFVRMWRLYLLGSLAAFNDRRAAVVPGGVRAAAQQQDSVDARDIYHD